MAEKRRAKKALRARKKVPAKRRPTLRLTWNGQVVAIIIGPPAADDLTVVWDLPVLEGGGYFTKGGKQLPKTRFIFLPGVNDFHFSPTGRFRKGRAPLQPPPNANDVHIEWEGGFITKAWWTRNRERLEEIPIAEGTTDLSVQW